MHQAALTQEGLTAGQVGPTIELRGSRFTLLAPAVGDVAGPLLATPWTIHARCFDGFAADQPEAMEPGKCYRNAGILARRRPEELHFVEGVYGKFLRDAPGIIAVCAHAWCVDNQGSIIEPTAAPGEAPFYFGVPVPHRDLPGIEGRPFAVDAQILVRRWRAYEEWLSRLALQSAA